MLKELEIQNFKSFIAEKMPLSPLTLFTGLNSSGKSSVLQAIRIFSDLSAGIQPSRQWNTLKSNLSVDKFFSITIDGSTIRIPSDVERPNILYPIQFEYVHISADRQGPQDTYVLDAAIQSVEIGKDGRHVYAYLEKNAAKQVSSKLAIAPNKVRLLKPNVEAWLQIVSPGVSMEEEIDLKQDEVHPYFNGIRPTETGYGLSYVLPVIVALVAPRKQGTVIMIENPEAHLHPRGQVEMGKLIGLSVASGMQVLVETHSEHIVDGIRLSVKKDLLSSDDVMMYYFERKDYETPSSVQKISVAKDGRLSKWPAGFFDQSLVDKRELL
jgi:predicted ATPase